MSNIEKPAAMVAAETELRQVLGAGDAISHRIEQINSRLHYRGLLSPPLYGPELTSLTAELQELTEQRAAVDAQSLALRKTIDEQRQVFAQELSRTIGAARRRTATKLATTLDELEALFVELQDTRQALLDVGISAIPLSAFANQVPIKKGVSRILEECDRLETHSND